LTFLSGLQLTVCGRPDLLWGGRVGLDTAARARSCRGQESCNASHSLLQLSAWLFVQGACARLGRLDADLLVACQPTRFLHSMIDAYASGAHPPSAACSPRCLQRRLALAFACRQSASSDPCLACLDVTARILSFLLGCLRRAARRWRCTCIGRMRNEQGLVDWTAQTGSMEHACACMPWGCASAWRAVGVHKMCTQGAQM